MAASLGHDVKVPLLGHALERLDAAVGKGDVEAGREGLDGLGGDHLAGPGLGHEPRGDVHGDAAYLTPAQLDLAGVDARADLDAGLAQHVADLEGAADGAPWPVERRQDAVAGGAVKAATVQGHALADDLVVLVEDLTPAAVAEPCGEVGRPDHVRDQDGRERAVDLGSAPGAGDELLDLVDQAVHVAEVDEPVGALELDQLGAFDVFGQVAAELDREEPETLAMQYQ